MSILLRRQMIMNIHYIDTGGTNHLIGIRGDLVRKALWAHQTQLQIKVWVQQTQVED